MADSFELLSTIRLVVVDHYISPISVSKISYCGVYQKIDIMRCDSVVMDGVNFVCCEISYDQKNH